MSPKARKFLTELISACFVVAILMALAHGQIFIVLVLMVPLTALFFAKRKE
jgi:hypothetical protein